MFVWFEGKDAGAGPVGPVQTPVAELLQQWLEMRALVRVDGVDDLRGDLVEDGAGDDAVVLEFAELLSEHLLGDRWHEPTQLAVPSGLLKEVEQENEFHFPPSTVIGASTGHW